MNNIFPKLSVSYKEFSAREKAKELKFHNSWLTFFDLFGEKDEIIYQFIEYVGNKGLIKDLEKCNKKFPTFGAAIKNRNNGTIGKFI